MKNSKQIKEIEKNIEKLKSDLAEQERLVAKLKKGTYEIGDEITYKNLDWYVIKTEGNKVILMLKDIIGKCAYSDCNSNDFKDSNAIKMLLDWDIEKLDIEELEQTKTNYDEDKYWDGAIRIPTLREIEILPMSIRKCGNTYWTMTSSYGVSEDCSRAVVFRVNSSGDLGAPRVYNEFGVRPVITLTTDKL